MTYSKNRTIAQSTSGATLADILERVLDKGVVIAGDIKVNLCDIELLTIQIRLIICSVDKAQEIGIDWWRTDPYLSRPQQVAALPLNADADGSLLPASDVQELRDRLTRLEASVGVPSMRGEIYESK